MSFGAKIVTFGRLRLVLRNNGEGLTNSVVSLTDSGVQKVKEYFVTEIEVVLQHSFVRIR